MSTIESSRVCRRLASARRRDDSTQNGGYDTMAVAAARAMSMLSPQPLIACNVYVSAGRPQHADLLLRLLSNAQVRRGSQVRQ